MTQEIEDFRVSSVSVQSLISHYTQVNKLETTISFLFLRFVDLGIPSIQTLFR
jgi:hypothetical protein